MALYAFDGTWNEDEDAPEQDTNVVRFSAAYGGPVEYREGVGTRFGVREEMYDAARANWEHGDRAVDIIGFSRGAALAVHFANILGKQGLALSDGTTVIPPIRFLGVWDIVGSFGIPINLIINFQNINLGWSIDRVPATVARCVHAMALEERRQTFRVTRLRPRANVEELWFRGVHGDVGGGNGNLERNNISLQWMLEEARAAGLPIDDAEIRIVEQATNRLASIRGNFDLKRNARRRVKPDDRCHPTAMGRTLAPGRRARFPVRAADTFNWSGVRIERDATYHLGTGGTQTWQDGGITCGANGWTSDQLPWFKEILVRQFENDRRVPAANWFELIGSLGDDEDQRSFFRVGTSHTFTAEADADLFAFANDLKTRYGNNQGQINVTIRRDS